MRRSALFGLAVASAAVVAVLAAMALLREGGPVSSRDPGRDAASRKGSRRARRPAPPPSDAEKAAAVPVPAPPPDVPPGEPVDPEEEAEYRAYPEDATGPVAYGRIARYADPDPECWVALESVDDPKREDPSVLETLPAGRFRLTGFPPGKYRVRAKGDDSLAAYSSPFEAVDGAVSDVGTIRLRRAGCISGVLLGASGREVGGEVRLFGRDPASLRPRVVEKAPAVGRQGFQLSPHEAGAFSLAAVADEGWAVHAGKTGEDGVAWAELRLRPWGRVRPAPAEGTTVLGTAAEPLEAPDLGVAAVRGGEGGAPLERLPAGRWSVTVRWRGPDGKEAAWTGETRVEDGAEALLAVPR
jgi:hypothetical protein